MDTTVTLDGGLLTVLVGVVLPLLVSLVTKRVTKSSVQTYLLVGLSIVGGALTSIAANGGTFQLNDLLINVALCFATGQTSYSRLWKPSGLSQKLQETGGLITAADPEKVKALEGKPADAEPAAEALGSDEQVVAVNGAQPVDNGVDEQLMELEARVRALEEENARLLDLNAELQRRLDAVPAKAPRKATSRSQVVKEAPLLTDPPKRGTRKSPPRKRPAPE